MRFDLWVPTASPLCTGELLARLAVEGEQRGFGGIWVGEHVVLFDEYESSYPYSPDGRIPTAPGTGILEPLNALSYMAAVTSRIRLGTAVCLLPQRNPVYTAKEVATVDWLSGGRVDFGVGVGWLREEFEAVGGSWPRRGARTDEYIGLLRTLWTEEVPSFAGDFYTLAPCRLDPKPRQDPHPPVHIGGETEAALRRVARFAQGWHTFNRPPEGLAEPLARLEAMLAEEGRKRSDVHVTVCPYFQELSPDRVEAYAAAGADAVSALVFPPSPDDVARTLDDLGPCLERAAAC